MRCSKCQFENEAGSVFCGNCGAALQTAGQAATVGGYTSPAEQIRCSNCGTVNPDDSLFCENCGSKLARPQSPHFDTISAQVATTEKSTSAAWWLMPIFLCWIGGVVAWLVVRENDRVKARRLLWLGIGMTVLWFVLSIAASAASNFFYAY